MDTQTYLLTKNVCLHLLGWRNEIVGSGDVLMGKDVGKCGWG